MNWGKIREGLRNVWTKVEKALLCVSSSHFALLQYSTGLQVTGKYLLLTYHRVCFPRI